MPQKRNPVAAATLVALARFAIALDGAMQGAALAREARDGAAWITEWLALPQILAAAGRALLTASDLCGTMSPAPDRMARALEAGGRLWAAEALVFALARDMPRPEAEAEVRVLVARAQAEAADLPALAAARFGDRAPPEAFLPAALLGEAPTIARRFVRAVRAPA
jgi:3-carboxy-cis,cis-muconate cycloisomerase